MTTVWYAVRPDGWPAMMRTVPETACRIALRTEAFAQEVDDPRPGIGAGVGAGARGASVGVERSVDGMGRGRDRGRQARQPDAVTSVRIGQMLDRVRVVVSTQPLGRP